MSARESEILGNVLGKWLNDRDLLSMTASPEGVGVGDRERRRCSVGSAVGGLLSAVAPPRRRASEASARLGLGLGLGLGFYPQPYPITSRQP